MPFARWNVRSCATRNLQDLQTELEHLRKERRLLEGEVDSLRPKLSKYRDPLMPMSGG